MTRRTVSGLALALAALPALTTPALATPTATAARPGQALYVFTGRLVADPPAGANALTVRVLNGNRHALRALVGRRATQAFRVDAGTRYLRWTDGVPAVVDLDDLRPGDRVSVRVRAHRRAPLKRVTSTPAAAVADRGREVPAPAQPQWVFRGTATGPAADGLVPVRVSGGNRRVLRVMLGQSLDRTFRYSAGTVFLHWSAGLPAVVTPAGIEAGDRLTIRIRAPHRSTLAAVEAAPAFRVAEHRRPVARR